MTMRIQTHVGVQEGRKQPKDKTFRAGYSRDIRTQTLDIPDPRLGTSRTKILCKVFFLLFRQGMAGMSRDLGRDVPGPEKSLCKKIWGRFFRSHVGGLKLLKEIDPIWK